MRIARIALIIGWLATAGAGDATERTFLADLEPEVLAAARESSPDAALSTLAPEAQLRAVFDASETFRFESGFLTVRTDRRWFSVLSPRGSGAPFLELRRWPGDTVVTFYAIVPGDGVPPTIDRARFDAAPRDTPLGAEWSGRLETEAGARPILWIERTIVDETTALGALLLPGDAGLGPGAVDDLILELRAVVARVETRAEVWSARPAIARATRLELPIASATPGEKTETEEPWQVARAQGFTVGMPPGIRVRRLDEGLGAPTMLPGGLIWFRGAFIDADGDTIRLGDGQRAGYVARVTTADKAWISGTTPPLGLAQGTRKAGESFDIAAERTGARNVTVERWTEQGFAGEWLVFRLRFASEGFEIGLPLLAGRQSESLYWIPLTWRRDTESPALPPIDAAERFGIHFDRFSPAELSRRPWSEGYLRVPGLRVELPKNWLPAASLRTSDGFPIRLVDRAGAHLATLNKLSESELPDRSRGWTEVRRRTGDKKAHVFRDVRSAELFLLDRGDAFLFEMVSEDEEVRAAWDRMLDSVQLGR